LGFVNHLFTDTAVNSQKRKLTAKLEELFMNILSFLILLLVAAICGSIGAAIAGHSSRGCLTSIVIGFIGAYIGIWLSNTLRIPEYFVIQGIPIIWSIIGAAIFVAVINSLTGRRKKSKK